MTGQNVGSIVVRAGVVVISRLLRQELEYKKYKKERLWIRIWISRREKCGASSTLLKEIKHEYSVGYRNILRTNGAQFGTWLQTVDGLVIKKEDAQMRMAIRSKIKLKRYLATGDSLKSLQYVFRVAECTISVFLPDVLTRGENNASSRYRTGFRLARYRQITL